MVVWDCGELLVEAPDDRVSAWSTDPRAGVPGLPVSGTRRPRPGLPAHGCRRSHRLFHRRSGGQRNATIRDRTTRRGRGKLELDPTVVRKARSLARKAGRPIVSLAKTHTTVSVERAALRLAGLSGADADGEPWVNHLVDAVREDVGLEHGVAVPVWHALTSGGYPDLLSLAQKAAAGSVTFALPEGRDATRARAASKRAVAVGMRTIDVEPTSAQSNRQEARRPTQAMDLSDRRDRRHLRRHPAGASGCSRGRDRGRCHPFDRSVAARLRSRGPTREGYAGTYATQENFRLMRAALDDVSRKSWGATSGSTNYSLRPLHARDRHTGRRSSAST